MGSNDLMNASSPAKCEFDPTHLFVPTLLWQVRGASSIPRRERSSTSPERKRRNIRQPSATQWLANIVQWVKVVIPYGKKGVRGHARKQPPNLYYRKVQVPQNIVLIGFMELTFSARTGSANAY
jgi:hypothetical protein